MSEILMFIVCFFIAEDLQESKRRQSEDIDPKFETPKHLAWLARKEAREKQREIDEFRQTIRDFEDSCLG